MASSLTTRIGFVNQVAKGTFPVTGIQLADGISAQAMPEFDYIENENHMRGIHERATSAQAVAEKSSQSVAVDYELGLYPLVLPHLLMGIGFVPATPVTASGISTHKFVKSNQEDAPRLSNFIRMGSSASRFSRVIVDVRFSQMVINLSRQVGATVQVTGMGIDETIIADGGYSVVPEEDTQFLPFLGGMLWDLTVGSDFNFGTPREHVITFDRPIEMDDQLLHDYFRNDNQEMSFGITGQMRGLEFGLDIYNELFYGGVADPVNADLSVVSVLTGLTLELNTGQVIPAALAPYKFIMNIPKAEIRMTNFRAQGNEIIRADLQYKMIDDAATPPVRIEVTNANATGYGLSNNFFVNAGGTNWTLPDATP